MLAMRSATTSAEPTSDLSEKRCVKPDKRMDETRWKIFSRILKGGNVQGEGVTGEDWGTLGNIRND